jgi:hypothetical protein
MSRKQDRLLEEYKEAVHGVIFTQVSVGECLRGGKVRGEHRFIDGVRLLGIRALTDRLKKFGANKDEFKKKAKDKKVEAIEVHEYLNRHVIGQAIVGKVMLEMDYGVYAAAPVVVCRVGDKALEQVCAKLGVKVWIPKRA